MEDQGKRILLFVVLAGLIFFGWQYMFPPDKAPPPRPATTSAGQPVVLTSPVGKPKDGTPAPAEVAVTEELLTIESSSARLTFSNVGGVVKDWELLYDPVKGRVMREHLIWTELPGKGLGAVNFFNSSVVLPSAAEWKGEKVSDRKVRYRINTGGLEVVKEFELFPEDFVLKMSVEIGVPAGAPPAGQRLAVSMYGHAPTGNVSVREVKGGQCHLNGEISTYRTKSLATRQSERHGSVKYAGLAHSFDLVAMSPADGKSESLACNVYRLEGVKDGVQVDLVYPETTLKAGEPPARRELTIYAGPRYLEKLEHADTIGGHSTGFRDVLDFGWFSFLAKPMLSLLSWLYGLVGNWGIAIILLTILVKLATLYWTTKSMRSMRAMAALKPDIEAIQKRYPDDKAKQQQAQMDLFKANGVSPLAGCLPMLLQMPIWFALYKMLSVAGELHRAVFIPGWLDDLTARDPYFILPIALTGLMFLQSKIQPATGDSMQQKMLQYGLPLMFGIMGLYFPSGLGVYMLTNSALSILHSLYMKRGGPEKTVKVPVAKADEKKADKPEKPAKPAAKPVIDVEADEPDADVDEPEVADEPIAPGKATPSGAGQGQRRGKRRPKKR